MRLGASRIAVIYLITSICWITLSDKALFLIHGSLSDSTMMIAATVKGFLFVIVTAFLLRNMISYNEKRLVSGEKLYREMYMSNPLPMWIYDIATLRFVSVNDAAIQHYGFQQHQFLAMSILDICPPEDKVKVIQSVKGITTNITPAGVWQHIKSDGTLIFVNIHAHQIVYNTKPHIMVIAHNVTDKVVFENKLEELNIDLREEKRKLIETQQIAKVGGWEFYPDSKTLVWSEEMFQLTETTPQQNLNLFDLYVKHIHPDDRSKMIEGLENLLKNGTPLDVTHRIELPSGRVKYFRQLGKLTMSKEGKPKVIGSAQDVTELTMLKTERNRLVFDLDNTLNSISDGFYTMNNDLIITKVNKNFEINVGLNASQIVGKSLTTIFPGIENRIAYSKFKEVLQTKTAVKFEAYSRHIQKWFSFEAYPTQEGIAVYFDDITERIEKDLQLKEAVERYEMVSKATQDVIYDYDVINQTLIYNNNIKKLIGPQIENCENALRFWESLIHPEDINIVADIQFKVVENKEDNWSYEYRINIGNGNYKYVYDQRHFIYNEKQELVRVIGAIKDIDDFRRVDNENKRLADIITKVNNMVLVMDTEARISWVNRAFEEYCGYNYEEIKGKNPGELLTVGETSKRTLEYIASCKMELDTFSAELEHCLKNGQREWVNIEFTPMYNSCNQHTGYIAVHQNITARKQKEKKVLQQNKVLQEISWMSSHQIRRPVASILGLTYLYKKATTIEDKEDIMDMINVSAEELDNIVHIITDKITDELQIA